jgi:hypothetical protein
MAEQKTNDPADDNVVWLSHTVLDGLGRGVSVAHYSASPNPDCTDCRGSGRIVLLTTIHPCEKCFGPGRVFIKPEWTTHWYSYPESEGDASTVTDGHA